MKKYKHKLSNSIAESTDTIRVYHIKLDNISLSHLPSEFIENSNDWEEVKEGIGQEPYVWKLYSPKEEPNYLITAFRSKTSEDVVNLESDGKYRGFGRSFEIEDLINCRYTEIYSVKNSKGEEFTIGDKVITAKDKFHISKFEICGKQIIVRFKETDEHDGLELISKIKSPIYTTTDGVEMFNGWIRKIYLLNKDLSKPSINEVMVNWDLADKETADGYLTFTSEENRDKYIKENSKVPIFVSADGKEIYEADDFIIVRKSYMSILKMTAHRNSGKDDDCMYFKTEKAAKEYIKENSKKPILISEDGYDMNQGDPLYIVSLVSNYSINETYTRKELLPTQSYFKYFGDRKKAIEYISQNKPKFSLKEIESCYPSPTNNPLFTTFIANLKKLGK